MYGIVYRIRSPSLGKDYYGSSTEGKEKRWKGHLRKYRAWKRGESRYNTSFELIEAGDAFIEVLEEKKDWKDKDELRWRERWYFDNFECVNKCRPIQNEEEKEEYMKTYNEANKEELTQKRKINYEANKEKILSQKKKYREENKEKIAEKSKVYYEANKEVIAEKSKVHYEVIKDKVSSSRKKRRLIDPEYRERQNLICKRARENNREENIKKQRERYNENKEVMISKKKERMLCDNCGLNVRRGDIAKHKKTMKCRAILLNPFSKAFNFF